MVKDEGFTQKEMLIRILDKLEKMDSRVEETHTLAVATNGKVKFLTKTMYALSGAIITLAGWFISHLTNSIN